MCDRSKNVFEMRKKVRFSYLVGGKLIAVLSEGDDRHVGGVLLGLKVIGRFDLDLGDVYRKFLVDAGRLGGVARSTCSARWGDPPGGQGPFWPSFSGRCLRKKWLL